MLDCGCCSEVAPALAIQGSLFGGAGEVLVLSAGEKESGFTGGAAPTGFQGSLSEMEERIESSFKTWFSFSYNIVLLGTQRLLDITFMVYGGYLIVYQAIAVQPFWLK